MFEKTTRSVIIHKNHKMSDIYTRSTDKSHKLLDMRVHGLSLNHQNFFEEMDNEK